MVTIVRIKMQEFEHVNDKKAHCDRRVVRVRVDSGVLRNVVHQLAEDDDGEASKPFCEMFDVQRRKGDGNATNQTLRLFRATPVALMARCGGIKTQLGPDARKEKNRN